MPAALEGKILPGDLALQRVVHRVQKIVAVELRVESYDVRAHHPHEDLLFPRTDPEGFRVGPGDVPEERYSGIGTIFLDQKGQEREVIVLDQDERRFLILDLLKKGFGEFL